MSHYPTGDLQDEPPRICQIGIRAHESQGRGNYERTRLARNCAFWELLRDRRLAGLKFRRQHAIGPYIVDLYCPLHRLVVELDGRSHDDRGAEDRQRQEYLELVVGLKVFRVGNDDVLRDRDVVVMGLLKLLGITTS